MADHSTIEWTDATWNPIRGCTRVSPGCGGPGPHGGCYAEGIAARFSKPGQAYHGIAEMRSGKPRWTGEISFGHDLDAPLRWRKPKRIFVNSMSDLFHEGLTREQIATVYAICIAAHLVRGHILQILTKRSGRMRAVLADPAFWEQVNAEAAMLVLERSDDARATMEEYGPDKPPPGIWLGVSAEDQRWADERVPDLLATPAAVRFVSAEPLLGPIDFRDRKIEGVSSDLPRDAYDICAWDWLEGKIFQVFGPQHYTRTASLNWIIVGGESGPGARPMHPAWVRSIRDQCAAAGVAFHFKQWGAHRLGEFDEAVSPCIRWQDGTEEFYDEHQDIKYGDHWLEHSATGCLTIAYPARKKAAGRLLDGVEHNGMPEVRHAG